MPLDKRHALPRPEELPVWGKGLQDDLQIQSDYVRAQFASLQSEAKEFVRAAQPAKAA
ncbi:hypothetical protein [Methylorubrum extorquens]